MCFHAPSTIIALAVALLLAATFFPASFSLMSDPRPFKCPYSGCDWTFSRKDHQTRHMRTHSGEKPYACDQPDCESRFARNDELKRHQRLMHGSASSRHEATFADTNQVVYNGYGQRPPDEYTSQSSRPSATLSGYIPGSHYATPQGPSTVEAITMPAQHATSTNHYSLSSHPFPPPGDQSQLLHFTYNLTTRDNPPQPSKCPMGSQSVTRLEHQAHHSLPHRFGCSHTDGIFSFASGDDLIRHQLVVHSLRDEFPVPTQAPGWQASLPHTNQVVYAPSGHRQTQPDAQEFSSPSST